jgi:hypothetical protein
LFVLAVNAGAIRGQVKSNPHEDRYSGSDVRC